MADILKITLPDGTTYNIKDNNALPLTGGQVTGPVTFGSSVSIDDLTVGNIIVTGNTSFVQGIPWSTITGAPTTISGYGITDAVTNVAYDSSTYNITKTINGTTSNVYQMPCIAGTGTNSLITGDLVNNTASAAFSLVSGLFNIEDIGTASDNPFNTASFKKYAFIIGNGSSVNARSNALTVDWYGNESLAGGLTLGKDTVNEATLTTALLKVLVSDGSAGQVLTKTANGFEWTSLPNANGVNF